MAKFIQVDSPHGMVSINVEMITYIRDSKIKPGTCAVHFDQENVINVDLTSVDLMARAEK
jgi:hypothetical protein